MSHHSFQITPHTLDHVLNFPSNMRKDRTHTAHDMAIPEDEVHTMRSGTVPGPRLLSEEEEDDEEDTFPVLMDNMSPATAARTRNKYANYINKALFHVSDDENLEALVDEAVLKLLGIKSLWEDKEFITKLYSDKEFASAVRAVYEKMAGYVRALYPFWIVGGFDVYVLSENVYIEYDGEIESALLHSLSDAVCTCNF